MIYNITKMMVEKNMYAERKNQLKVIYDIGYGTGKMNLKLQPLSVNLTRKINKMEKFKVQSSLGQHEFSQHEFAQHEFLRLQNQIFIARFYTYKIQKTQCYANFFGNFFKSFSNLKDKLKRISLSQLLGIIKEAIVPLQCQQSLLDTLYKNLHFDLHSTNFT